MDVSIDWSGKSRNTTEVTAVDEEDVEALSIIVWCVGGILLITLLSLLARIILAKKYTRDEYETLSHTSRRRNTLRICIDARGHIVDAGFSGPPPSALRNNTSHIPECQSSPSSSSNSSTIYNDRNYAQNIPTPRTIQNANQSEILTRHLRVGEYINSLPIPQNQNSTAEIIPTNNSGSHASVHGVVISPPSYSDVINSTTRIPSVIVDRRTNAPRRQLFSL